MRKQFTRLLALAMVLALLVGVLPAAGAADPLDEQELVQIDLVNGDFESGTKNWNLVGLTGTVIDNSSSSQNASHILDLWVSNEEATQIIANYSVELTEGDYRFEFQMDGADMDSNLWYTVTAGETVLVNEGPVVTTGWDNWLDFSTGVFHVSETSTVIFSLHGVSPAGYWGHLDNLTLYGTGRINMPEILLPNGDFENGDGSNWNLDCFTDANVVLNSGSAVNSSYVLDMGSTPRDFYAVQYSMTLTPGTYRFSIDLEGSAGGHIGHVLAMRADGGCLYESDEIDTAGSDQWQHFVTNEFTLESTQRLYFEIDGGIDSGDWYRVDNLRLFGTGELYGGLPPLATDDGNFDYGGSSWSIRGFSAPASNDGSAVNSSYCLPLWISNEADSQASASYLMHLLPGSYELSYDLEGREGLSGLRTAVSFLGASLPEEQTALREGETILYESEELETHGYDQWETLRTDEFTLAQPGWVKFELSGTIPAGYWGHFDNLQLWGDGDYYPEYFQHEPSLAVPKVKGVDAYEFVRGADISSYQSLIQAGAQFYDYEGNLLDDAGFFQLLSRAGFNYVRIRVWVDPFDAQGNGYGGGNNDLEAAKYLARLATDVGLRVMIDFHYSDFWADPGKQQAPKAWAGYTLAQKVDAVEQYTYDSLKTVKQWADGNFVDMVQIGNETTSGICGENSWANMAQIFAAGARAVRRLDEERMEETKITIHFTNPEKTANFKGFADKLNQYGVDYDVFATSWYPYWHGSTDNLTNVLKYVADTYDKQVLVAETSWAWTLADGDGWDNTVSPSGNSTNMPYAFSQQGQADELVAAARAVSAVGEKGLGVFYWENAWIPVRYAYDEAGDLDQSILASNQAAWEQYGCGWASSYAGEYQADAAQWYGGSAVDNQSMFDFHGKALDSLWTWQYMMFGTENLFGKQVEEVESVALSLNVGEALSLPETVRVLYNIDGAIQEPVAWNETDIAAVDVNTPGVYSVRGEVSLSYGLGTTETVAAVTVLQPNLLQNPGFELNDLSMYAISGGHDRSTDTPHGETWCLHFYNANGSTLDFAQTLTLEPGSYSFSLFAQGDAKGGTEQYTYVDLPGQRLTQDFALAGWAVWQNPEISFTLTEAASVTVGGHIAYGAGGWGTFDDLSLRKQAEQAPQEPILDENLVLFASISAGEELSAVYGFRQSLVSGYESFWLEVSKLDRDGSVLERSRFGEGQDYALNQQDSLWTAKYSGIKAKEMGVTFSAVLHCLDAQGRETVSPAKENSIRAYLLEELTDDENTDALRTLAADMLNYGAAAQVLLDYDPEHLVNADLTQEQASALEEFRTKTTAPAVQENSENGPVLFSSVSLGDRVKLSLTAVSNAPDSTVQIRISDRDSGEVIALLDTAAYNTRIHTASFREVGAQHMRRVFSIVTLVDGVETGNTLTWSVEGYVKVLRESGSAAEIAMADALLIYGDSLAAYLAQF